MVAYAVGFPIKLPIFAPFPVFDDFRAFWRYLKNINFLTPKMGVLPGGGLKNPKKSKFLKTEKES